MSLHLQLDETVKYKPAANQTAAVAIVEEQDSVDEHIRGMSGRPRGGSLSSSSASSTHWPIMASCPPTPTRPSRTLTCISLSPSTSSSSSSTYSRFADFPRTPNYSPITSATSLPLSFRTFSSCFSAGSGSLSLLPPYAASPYSSPADAKSILTLDGGGVRGIFAPLFLRALQAHLPDDVDARSLLDLVGGTSTGGVSALMFARLGMSIDEWLDVYKEMPKKLFGKRSRRARTVWWMFTSAQHSTSRQKKLYQRVVRDALGNEGAGLQVSDTGDNQHQCPVFVVAVDSEDVSQPAVFTSYSGAPKKDDGNEVPVSIVTAALATSAAPTYYHPTLHAGRAYVDGGVGFNNPSEIAVKQLTQLYGPSAYAHTIISLGTGRRKIFPYTHPKRSLFGLRSGLSNIFSILNTFALISTDSESVHQRMTERFDQTGAYYRFNPPGLEDIALDDWTAVETAMKCCQEYLNLPETQERIEEVAQKLMARDIV